MLPVRSDESCAVPWSLKQKGAAVLAVLFVLNPFMAVVGVALNSSRVSPGAVGNATCPPLRLSPDVIQEYLARGTASHFKSVAQGRLQSDVFDSFDDRELVSRLYSEAEGDFRKMADDVHPAERAIAVHQARQLEKENSAKERQLRIFEAVACSDAARVAETAHEKLQWVARGLEELDFQHEHFYCRDSDQCNVASTLWLTAAEAFLQKSDREPHSHYSMIHTNYPGLEYNTFYAAEALRIAALCTKHSKCLGAEEMAVADYEEAICLMRDINTAYFSVENRGQLQDEILSTTISAYRTAVSYEDRIALRKRIVAEAMTAANIYAQEPTDIYCTIQRALRLEDAAFYSLTMMETRDRLLDAIHLVEGAWESDPEGCLNVNEFYRPTYGLYARTFSLENTLLGRLRAKLKSAEQELVNEKASIWSWFTRLISRGPLE